MSMALLTMEEHSFRCYDLNENKTACIMYLYNKHPEQKKILIPYKLYAMQHCSRR